MLSRTEQLSRLPKRTFSSLLQKQAAAVWSGELSFASPEADFNAFGTKKETHAPTTTTKKTSSSPTHVWSRSISFASPEVDFTDTSRYTSRPIKPEWSNTLSFASPEVDFAAPSHDAELPSWEWSDTLSFASPESDFVVTAADTVDDDRTHVWEWSNDLMFASPESDFVASSTPELTPLEELSKNLQSPDADWMVASPESALGSVHLNAFLDPQLVAQLHEMEQAESHAVQSLPATLDQVLANPLDSRAMVVTEARAPFRIVHVNDAWVGLCGFSHDEARYGSLNMIQGPETDLETLQDLVDDLLEGKESHAVVTNYAKDGRPFRNNLRARPLVDADNQVTLFVGVLEELTEEEAARAAA